MGKSKRGLFNFLRLPSKLLLMVSSTCVIKDYISTYYCSTMEGEKKRGVTDLYNTLGGRIYDLRYAKEQGSKYDALLNKLPPDPDGTVLDVGCGTGLLAKRFKSGVVGLDVSTALIFKALSRLKSNGSNHLILGDAEALPFRDSSIDRVYSVTLLQNLPNPSLALLEMKRVGRERAGITSLKKVFTEKSFRTLLKMSDFSSFVILHSHGLNDWVAIIDL
ncbi:hypothetical protein CL673_01045 [Candidatus Bathyarchaeota archaeon]|nr:hypothetical protein [Candidatus Bathyarchaeota archaeon]